jgi:hypothetical protein
VCRQKRSKPFCTRISTALPEIAAGSSVFVDANIFIYHFAGQSEDCSIFLARIERGELQGYTGQVGILEAAHRLMMLEAIEQGVPVKPNPAARLARQPQVVRRLSKYYFSLQRIPKFGIEILALPADFITQAKSSDSHTDCWSTTLLSPCTCAKRGYQSLRLPMRHSTTFLGFNAFTLPTSDGKHGTNRFAVMSRVTNIPIRPRSPPGERPLQQQR